MKMNILIISDQVIFFRHIEPILKYLGSKEHTFKLWFGDKSKRDVNGLAVQEYLSQTNNSVIGSLLSRQDNWLTLITITRDLLGYSIYLKPEHTSPLLAERFKRKMSKTARRISDNWLCRNILQRDNARFILRKVEQFVPVSKEIRDILLDENPDVIVVVTSVIWDTPVVDYVKAAMALTIPTVLVVASWDNLTTKSTFHVIPDAILVWNEALADEAVILHDVPREKIIVTGAQTFDYLFEMQPSCDYSAYCEKLGLPSYKPFILYLGSSASVSGDETAYARDFLKQVSKESDISIVLRPHPFNHKIWDGFAAPNLVVSPKGGSWPNTLDGRQDLFDALYHCRAVVGVNTSAMLEAAIMDKPCVTIMTDQYRVSQELSGHFQHLMRAGFLEVASSFEEASKVVSRLVNGQDHKAKQRRQFVQTFIRPCGLDIPAGKICWDAIKAIANRERFSPMFHKAEIS